MRCLVVFVFTVLAGCSSAEATKAAPVMGGAPIPSEAPATPTGAGTVPSARDSDASAGKPKECVITSLGYGIWVAIEFRANESDVPADQMTTIKLVADGIKKKLSRHAIDVEGHADRSESKENLSRSRAENVVELLRQDGVDPKRLFVVDKGAAPPPQGVERNSRVTFNVRVLVDCP